MLNADLPTTGGGGVPHQVSRLAEVLAHRGHEVTIFSFSPAPDGAPYEVRRLKLLSQRFSSSKLGHLVGTPIAFAAQRYRAFDVVHAHGDNYLLFGRSTPIVRTYYGTAREEARHAERLKRRISQRLLYAGERVARHTSTVTVGISENTSRALGGLDFMIPCGVDRGRFHPGPKSSVPAILFVGTLRGRKRGYLVLKAFEEQVRPRVPDCELWFVGDEAVVGEGVQAYYKVDDETVARLFREAWVFTLPSSYEGFGVPYIEAMASGTAVVATPNVGAVEMVRPDSGGVIVPAEELGRTLAELLDDPAGRRELEERGRAYSEPYDWQVVASRYEEVYEQALDRSV